MLVRVAAGRLQATGCRRLEDQVGCEGTLLVSESYKVSNELYMNNSS